MSSEAVQSPSAEPAGPAGPQYPDTHYVQASEMPADREGVVEVDMTLDPLNQTGGPLSDTTSVSSSVFSFTYANGRRYQSDRFRRADYFLPNDEREQDRLDLVHHIFLLLGNGRLYFTPLENPLKVLDVGTGTGIWAIDFADLHPEAKVIGTDISPIQPPWIPPNTTFVIDDMEDEWTFNDNYFDYIHMRSLSGSFADWDGVLAQAYKKMTPGGYLEFQDYGCELFTSDGIKLEGLVPEHPATKYIFHIIRAAERAGRPLVVARDIADRMEKAGFIDIQQKTVILPLGPWPRQRELKELGKWGKLSLLEGSYPYALLLLTREGWTEEEIREMVDDLVSSVDNGSYYTQGWFVYGKKPAASAA